MPNQIPNQGKEQAVRVSGSLHRVTIPNLDLFRPKTNCIIEREMIKITADGSCDSG